MKWGEKWILMIFSGAELYIKMSNVVSKAKIHANWRFPTEIKVQISCQNHKFNNLIYQYRYRISYKIAKKANPAKRICPFSKTISQI